MDDIDKYFLKRFENTELTHEEYDHKAHMRVAFLYLTFLSKEKTSQKIRAGLLKLNQKFNLELKK